MPTTLDRLRQEIADLFGEATALDWDQAERNGKVNLYDLLQWAYALVNMDADQIGIDSEEAIHTTSTPPRQATDNTFYAARFKITACAAEARIRNMALGHREKCPNTIYMRTWTKVIRTYGYEAPTPTCTC